MRRHLTASLTVVGLMVAHGNSVLGAPVCVQIEPGKLRCAITQRSDCERINDYPYARDLFCAAAYSAAQTMVSEIAKTLGVKGPTDGIFHYYQTLADPEALPDDQAQTTVPCLDTVAPYPSGSDVVAGAGTPLCNLVAYVTSPGPAVGKHRKGDSIPEVLRGFPDYFGKLYSPEKGFALTRFRTGSVFDPIVAGLGAAGHDGFTADYPKFSPTKLYDPDHWTKDSQYRGISGGGGGGWGGEVAILGSHGPVVQLAFGGGGGGGMTSFRPGKSRTAITGLGAGGGGGVQFANGYRFNGRPYDGLGLGAGMGSGETAVQYSYNDFVGSTRPPQPVHQYNPSVIAEYETQLKNLGDQLRTGYHKRKTIVLRGGGGMGAGTEYLMTNGQAFVPHALSTQGGFQFNYAFLRRRSNGAGLGAQALDDLNAQQEDVYAVLGDAYRTASRLAFEECGRDYSNFACMCPREHAIVICLVRQQVDDPKQIPGWLQQRHCPGDASSGGQNGSRFSSYQQLLLDAASAMPMSCAAALTDFFTSQNNPTNEPD